MNCNLQIGGSDQWGNIVNGVDLIRKIGVENYNKAFGLTSHLITTSDGKKMGKTAAGAVWLDENLFSPSDYFQYFRNVSDQDVYKFLKLFTDLEVLEIEKLKNNNINEAKEILAFEATKICHGLDNANNSLQKAREIFAQKNSDFFEKFEVKKDTKLLDFLSEKSCESKSEAKRLMRGGGVKIDGKKISDENFLFDKIGKLELSIGKKSFYKINVS
jgi:tyrosyl-tRNA synthetase